MGALAEIEKEFSRITQECLVNESNTVSDSGIGRHLDLAVKVLLQDHQEQEQKKQERNMNVGVGTCPCVEYLLGNKIMDTIVAYGLPTVPLPHSHSRIVYFPAIIGGT